MKKLKRTFALLAALFVTALSSAAPSFAANISHLTWQRGVAQTVEISTLLTPAISHIDMLGQGATFTFAPYTVANQRMVFQVNLPGTTKLGEYSIRLFKLDGSTQELSTVKVVEYQSAGYNPVTDVKTVTALSLTLFTILALWTGSSDSLERRKEDEYSEDQTTYSSADSNSIAHETSRDSDYHKGLVTSVALDHFRNDTAIRSSRFSPMISRLISDGGYLQFSLGSLILFFPLFGLALGTLAFKDISGIGHITTPSLSISIALIILGTLDAGSAFIAVITFAVLSASSHLFLSAYDFRTLIGLAFLWFTPALIANASRPLRRSVRSENTWERLIDVVVGPLTTTWAVYGMVKGLDGFAHLRLPLGQHALICATAAGVTVFLRYLIEEYVARRNEHYLAFLSPKRVNEQGPLGKWLGRFAKGFLFLFLAISFLGPTWYLWAALLCFFAPTLIKSLHSHLPNSPLLYQLIPVGIPMIIVMCGINKVASNWASSLTSELGNQSRVIFLLMSIPGLIISVLKAFGRSPKPGDVRWYLRETNAILYRIVGPVLLSLAIALTVGVMG